MNTTFLNNAVQKPFSLGGAVPHTHDSHFKQHAFTRIDLLAVVGVRTILVWIPLKMLASLRSNGRTALCSLNEFKLTRAWNQYALEHGGRLVGNLDGSSVSDLSNSNKT